MTNREVAEHFMGKAASAEDFDEYCECLTVAAIDKYASELVDAGYIDKEAKSKVVGKIVDALRSAGSKAAAKGREVKEGLQLGHMMRGASTVGSRTSRAAEHVGAAAGKAQDAAVKGGKWVAANKLKAAGYGGGALALGGGGYAMGKKASDEGEVSAYLRGHFEREILKEASKMQALRESAKKAGGWVAGKAGAAKEKVKEGGKWAWKHKKGIAIHTGGGAAVVGGGYAAGRARR